MMRLNWGIGGLEEANCVQLGGNDHFCIKIVNVYQL